MAVQGEAPVGKDAAPQEQVTSFSAAAAAATLPGKADQRPVGHSRGNGNVIAAPAPGWSGAAVGFDLLQLDAFPDAMIGIGKRDIDGGLMVTPPPSPDTSATE